MATKTIYWSGSSGDKITLTYTAATGDQVVAVSSDPNTSTAERTKTITFTPTGGTAKTLTVTQAGATPQEYTARLVPSAYTRSNTSYVVVSDAGNMYDNTSDTSDYASLRGRGGRSSNSTYYCFIRGFNFSAIPSGATVKSFRVLIRCYRNSYQNTGSSYRIRLASSASNNSVISGTTTSTDIGITQSVIEIPTGSLTWATLSGYKSNFCIEVRLRNTSTTSSNYPYVYVYGAEIEVKYEI